VHKSGEPNLANLEIKSIVKKENLMNMISWRKIYKFNFFDKDYPIRPTNEIVKTAYEKIGDTKYSLECDNCQHFCFICRNGIAKSPEVNFKKSQIFTKLILKLYYRLIIQWIRLNV